MKYKKKKGKETVLLNISQLNKKGQSVNDK